MKLVFHRYRYKSGSKTYLFLLMMILTLSHNFFYLWLQDDYMLGSLKFSDISIVLSILFAGVVLIQYGRPKSKIKYYIYSFVMLSLVSAITANVIHDQNLFRGIFAQRCQIAYLLLFLGVQRLFEREKINKYDIQRIIFILCWIELFVCTVQYFIYLQSGTLFLNVGVGVRYDSGRIYFDPAILLMAVFNAFQDLLKKGKIKNLLFIIWVAFFLMVITKMRAMTFAFLFALIVGLVIWKGEIIKKIIISFVCIVGGVKILSQFAIVQDLLSALENLNADANYNIRNLGRAQFLSEFYKSPLTGRGYPSISSSSAYGALKGYLFVDNGIFGLIYSYGILGMIWWISFWIALFVKAWKVRKKQMAYILYLIYYTVGLMTDFAWFWTATCSFSIMIALLLNEEKLMKEGC